MDDLIKQLTEKFDLDAEKAKGILDTVAGFLSDKLPEPIGSKAAAFLQGEQAEGLLDQAQDALGGLLGGDD